MTNRRPTFGKAALLDSIQLAAFLGCSPRQVRHLAARGLLPKAVRVGRLLRWPRESIERWLADRTSP
jgi:excisionase family DNA binding protein